MFWTWLVLSLHENNPNTSAIHTLANTRTVNEEHTSYLLKFAPLFGSHIAVTSFTLFLQSKCSPALWRLCNGSKGPIVGARFGCWVVHARARMHASSGSNRCLLCRPTSIVVASVTTSPTSRTCHSKSERHIIMHSTII